MRTSTGVPLTLIEGMAASHDLTGPARARVRRRPEGMQLAFASEQAHLTASSSGEQRTGQIQSRWSSHHIGGPGEVLAGQQ